MTPCTPCPVISSLKEDCHSPDDTLRLIQKHEKHALCDSQILACPLHASPEWSWQPFHCCHQYSIIASVCQWRCDVLAHCRNGPRPLQHTDRDPEAVEASPHSPRQPSHLDCQAGVGAEEARLHPPRPVGDALACTLAPPPLKMGRWMRLAARAQGQKLSTFTCSLYNHCNNLPAALPSPCLW